MGRISLTLPPASILGLDTSILIYHFEAHPLYSPLTDELLSGVEAGRWKAVTSVIALMEISVRPIQSKHQNVARQVEALLANFPHLEIVEIDRSVSRMAARLWAEFHLRPPDALQAAACLQGGCQTFITNDRRLEKLCPILGIMILDDYLSDAGPTPIPSLK